MLWHFLVCGVVALRLGSDAAKIPSFMKICARNDPKFKECAYKSALEALPHLIKGNPKYRIPNMDPLVIDQLTLATDPGRVGLVIGLENVKLYGMPESQLLDFNIDFEKRTLSYKLRLPRCEIISNYNISGKILVLPITGHGELNLTLVEYEYRFTINYDLVKKENGKEYMVLGDGGLQGKEKKAYVYFSNLFNGDQVLGDQMNALINENLGELRKELSPMLSDGISLLIKNVLSNTIVKISYDELFPIK